MNQSKPAGKDIAQLIEKYSYKLTDKRKQRLDETIRMRTRFYTIALEDLKDAHNISAVIRSSEVFGLQDVHIIEEINPYTVSKAILKGSFKWLNIYRYARRASCMQRLKTAGYQIAVASCRTDKKLEDLDLSLPTAFYMGSESLGNHPNTLKMADAHFRIHQYGLTESMNVSVCAGVLMASLARMMDERGREKFCLSREEQQQLKADFYERSAVGVERNSPVVFIE